MAEKKANKPLGRRKRGPEKGTLYKSVEQHILDGTYRQDRHGPVAKPLELQKPEVTRLPSKKETQKWIRSEADERAVANGCRFSVELAEYFEKWAHQYIRLSEGLWAGKPFEFMDWQRDDLFYPLFGWVKRHEEHDRIVRRFNRVYCEVPKKSGKSPTGALVGVYMLAGDGEHGAKVFSTATDKDQAGIVHTHAIHMVEDSPALQALCKINRTTRHIHFKPTRSVYSVVSGKASEHRNREGLNGSCAILDELHAWQGDQLYNALKWMFATRLEPIMFQITTAGDDMQSVCRLQHEYAKGVMGGTVHDDGFLGTIYAADDDDDWMEEKTWAKANPSLGKTVQKSELRASATEAAARPSMVSAFKRYRLNIWCTAENPWLSSDRWKTCQEDYTEDDLEGCECYAALDLAKTLDMTALCLLFPDGEVDGVFRLLNYYFMPEDTFNERKHMADYRGWVEGGWLELSPGGECDYGYVFDRINELADKFDILELVYDPWNARDITSRVEDELGIDRIEFPQTINHYSAPSKEFERLHLQGNMRHNGNPVTAWQVSHVTTIEDRNQNIRPVKRKRGDHRTIDGVVAAVMALSRAMAWEGGCVYDDEGIKAF